MCGICGIARPEGADRDRLAELSATLAHRGPDSDGAFVDGPVGLAARRLSIIDLETGDQPLANEDGTVHVVQNGELYNYRELRDELARAGHHFRTHGDTEVLAHAYEEWGDGLTERLRGMFAIAIWDARRQRLVVARDRFGIKPLYYRADGSSLEFASELRALPRGEVDLDALEAFLAFGAVPAPLSIFQGTRKLPAGHLLVWERGQTRLERYARPAPPPAAGVRRESEDELAQELRERLRDSVRAHLVADVPVGVLLSGGIDSSLLALFAAEESSEQVRTFTIGFEECSSGESADARLVARQIGADHHEVVLRPGAAQLLPALAEAFDEPFADSSALPAYLVSELAAGEVKVALSGEGGDVLFGGCSTYAADLIARHTGGLAGLTRHHGWGEIFSADARAELTGHSSGRLQDLDAHTYLVDDLLVKTDRASMAWSLEARVPFLDTAVTELALALPARMKVRRLKKQVLLRKAAEGLLPPEIVRGRKRDSSIPAATWRRGELEPFARDTLSPDTLRRQGYFRPEAVTRLLDAHVAGREDLSRQLWCLLAFTLWHEHQVERTPGAVRPASLAVVIA